MADMVKISSSVTERQITALRAEARRRDVTEGEVLRGIIDFWIDAAAGKVALCASVMTAPVQKAGAA